MWSWVVAKSMTLSLFTLILGQRSLSSHRAVSKSLHINWYRLQEVIDVAGPLLRDEGRDLSEVTPSSRFSFSNFSFKVRTIFILYIFPAAFFQFELSTFD
jgi:hypothetical protein